MLSVGIFASPREPFYLNASLDSYFTQWDLEPIVVCEPDTPSFTNRCKRIDNKRRLGGVLNWLKTLSILYEASDEPWLMICEDDIFWRREAAVKVRHLLRQGFAITENGPVKDYDLISPYCALKNSYVAGKRNRWFISRGNLYGALCLILRRKAAEKILSNQAQFLSFANVESRLIHLDYAIGKMIRPILSHNPTLILHLGDVSTNADNNGKVHPSRMPAL